MDVSHTIIAKSDQLNADDLISGAITVAITGVSAGPADQPVHIKIDGGRQPFKPCKGMRRVLVAAYGARADSWVGKKLRLYREPTVKWAGKESGGIRISHLSHIGKPLCLPLAIAKGVRIDFIAEVLPEAETVEREIAEAGSMDTLKAVGERVALMHPADIEKVRPLFKAAREKFKAATNDPPKAAAQDANPETGEVLIGDTGGDE